MLTNHEANATKFLSDLEETNLNFGWNCYLFKKLVEFNLISLHTDNHAEFIRKYKDQFVNTHYTSYFNSEMSTVNIEEYIDNLFENNPEAAPIDENINRPFVKRKFNELIKELVIEKNAKHIGRTFALYYSLNIQESKNDYQTKLENQNIHDKWTNYHKINPEDRSEGLVDWPVNKIYYRLGGEKIPTSFYAAMGFNDDPCILTESNLSAQLKPIGFFDTLFNTKDGKEFSHIVALGYTQNDGEKTTDFDNYFQPREGSDEVILDNAPLQDSNHCYTLLSQQVNNPECPTYQLSCTQNDFITHTQTTKQFLVSQIKTADGTETPFTKEFLINFTESLNDACKKGKKILVHCKAGIGRTGNIIGFMIASQDDVFAYLFSDDNFKNILERLTVFIESLRESRAGFVAEPCQLYAIIECALRHRQELKAASEKKAIASQLQEYFGGLGLHKKEKEIATPEKPGNPTSRKKF